ncbi:MAG: DUF2061 domain-containing protein [Paracoccaceae bacterium]|jgi:uncharacterized membrane protein|nr:DUF2061 domain-containing protein [Paracoccaceae bacterium]MDG1369913.1 DUF2061 domain-containing protein [Paracoccaceae bacterium]MDG1969793.1 DUF2061 domain-containing protein [Paracoccaceae bacterium]
MREQPEKPIFGPEDSRLDPKNPPEVKAWRSVAKAVSWRVVGTIDTLILSWLIITYLGPLFGLNEGVSHADNLETATYIAVTEVLTKMVLYFLHERGWAMVKWDVGVDDEGHRREGIKRSGVKTGTWRMIASLDTFLLAFFFTGNIGTALSIGGLEIVTKLVLYFFHERAWSRVKFGLG